MLPWQISAQQYKAITLSLPEGLSQSTVYDIVQDHNGFVWMATQDGLNKYDGSTFTVYRDEPFDTSSISSSHISALLCDSKGRLWVGSLNHGLNLYEPGKETFIHFTAGTSGGSLKSNLITALHEDHSGNIWVGTANGLHRIKEMSLKGKSNFSFEPVPLLMNSMDSITDKFINVISSDKRQQLWVGTYAGLFKINTSENFQPKSLPVVWFSKKNERISDDFVHSICVDQTDNVWVGTREGLNRISYPGEHITIFNGKGMSGNNITSLLAASTGDIWIGYNGRGIQVIRKEFTGLSAESIKFSLPEAVNESEIFKNGKTISLWEDRITKGMIWAGFNAGGTVRLVPVTKKFFTDKLSASGMQTSFVTCLIKDKENGVYVGTNEGLISFDRNRKPLHKYFPSELTNHREKDNYINGLAVTSDGELVFSSENHIFIKKVTGKINSYPIPDNKIGNTRTLVKDHNGNLYVILRYGIYKFDPQDGTFIKTIEVKDPARLEDKAFFLSHFYIDRKGNYWVGSSSGLDFYRASTTTLTGDPVTYHHNKKDTTSLRNQNILYIGEDREGTIWLGTMNGLTKVVSDVKGNHTFINYSTRNGLVNNVIYSVISDPETGHIWLSTNNGLTEFNPEGFAVATYDVHDGLQSNEFNSYASFRSDDGEMFFGGIEGYTSFYPKQILRDTSAPRIVITEISLNGNRSLTFNDFGESKTIDLKYRENTFTINFIALHYVDPQKNQYAYRLEGFHDGWIYAGNSHSVNFPQLSPGKYIFRVKAANSDGFYNASGDMFTIIINPPFYKTIWFYLMIAVLVATVLWGLHKYRLRLKLGQVREVEKIRRATAADFHDELGHKLTIISWFAEILKKKIGPEQTDLRPHLDRIIETSGTLYHTMKDMLWAMDPDKDSVYDLYSQLREFGQELFDKTGVLFESEDIPSELKDKNISPSQRRHVLLIFKEVMHNSLKHAHSTNTYLDMVKDENMIKFRFRDNGTGFKMNGHNVGHGLNNVKRRAGLISARVEIRSEGQGTVAELTLPETEK
jgi:ligand-binding sensor domain-containing protein